MAQSGCTNVLIGMAPCLTYVTGSSKTPSSSCCSSLASVVKSQPQCLCTAIDGSTMASLGISINKTIALSLPHVCNVKTPPVSRCNAENNAPTMAPIKSPEDESAKAPTPTIFAGGPTAQSGCTNVLIGMAPCLNYVTGSSKTPSSSCCSSLASVVKSQPQCLCTAIDGSTMASLGININKTIALSLPRACNMKTPPVSRCNAGTNAPTMAPIKSPEDKSANAPTPTSIFAGGYNSNGETSNDADGNT
ncbi:hypothetical protein E3N88_01081 [Mikania micrantha]|uniref:Bifunctional inhibitor/plant lipid transfer protein/seed storage helical domain-containing protein n=1 Tax=Mikania micrantha TaxID=192012 RepID=A0A5N6PZZ7_9ASTR|nr:hypothetical protein E3N88_01081 [Mikania micrantha]